MEEASPGRCWRNGNQYLMPLKQTRNALADAQKLLDKKQYYEANLALKGAEDGIIVDSEALFVN